MSEQTMTLIIHQRNVMLVLDYPFQNFVDAGIIDRDRTLRALGQILDGLSRLHANG